MSGSTKEKSRKTAETRAWRRDYFLAQRRGKCMKCGYSRCKDALHWHHVWPKEKSFGLSMSVMHHAIEKLQREINKCVLLCGNCHSELHAGVWDLTEGEKAAYKEQK